jgi:hypothetical protein
MTKTKTTVLVVAVLLLVAAAVIIKLVFFPSIKDVWFTMNPELAAGAGKSCRHPSHAFCRFPAQGDFLRHIAAEWQ